MDKGFTKIPNDIMDALIGSGLSGAQIRVVLYIIRKTYGWEKNYDRISITKMAKELRISKRWCIGIVDDLRKSGIIVAEDGGVRRAYNMRISDPDDWDKVVNETSPDEAGIKVNKTSPDLEQNFTRRMNKTSPDLVKYSSPPKERKTLLKDTIKESDSTPSSETDDDDDEGYTVEEYYRMIGADYGALRI